MKQLPLSKDLQSSFKNAYGGVLLKTRKARSSGRPLAIKHSMHLVLRSTKATGAWSFKYAHNERKVEDCVRKFSKKYGVRIESLANVGNHLHFHIQLSSRYTYKPFIRALTSAIAMAVTGRNRWTIGKKSALKFWDYRPFTRVVTSFRARLNLSDYILINKLEGVGFQREQARIFTFERNRRALLI